MKCHEAKQQIERRLEGSLTEAEHQALLEHCRHCETCAQEYSSAEHLAELLDSVPEEQVPVGMEQRFNAMLEKEIQLAKPEARPRRSWLSSFADAWRQLGSHPVLLAGYSACLLLLGLFVGSRFLAPTAPESSLTEDTRRELAALRGQVEDMGQLVAYSVIRQESEAKRLRLVSAGPSQAQTMDDQLVKLVGALTYDPSTNVRLSALESLYPHADREAVRDAVLVTLPRERSPLVQMRMIDFLASVGEPQAAPALEALSRDGRTDSSVREAARRALSQL
jgi:hypothetical protein